MNVRELTSRLEGMHPEQRVEIAILESETSPVLPIADVVEASTLADGRLLVLILAGG